MTFSDMTCIKLCDINSYKNNLTRLFLLLSSKDLSYFSLIIALIFHDGNRSKIL